MDNLEFLSISKFRAQTEQTLETLDEKEGYLILSRSKPKAVLLDIGKYHKTQELIEDLLDAAQLQRSRGEKGISWKKYLRHRYGNSDKPKGK